MPKACVIQITSAINGFSARQKNLSGKSCANDGSNWQPGLDLVVLRQLVAAPGRKEKRFVSMSRGPCCRRAVFGVLLKIFRQAFHHTHPNSQPHSRIKKRGNENRDFHTCLVSLAHARSLTSAEIKLKGSVNQNLRPETVD